MLSTDANTVATPSDEVGTLWILSAPLVGLMLLTAQLLPPLPFYLGLAGSMAVGFTGAATLSLFLCLLNDLFTRQFVTGRQATIDVNALGIVLAFCGFAVIHAMVADAFQSLDASRFAASLVPLSLLLLGGIGLGRALASVPAQKFDRVARLSFGVLCFVMILHFTPFQPRASEFPKSTFPFTETSHFGLAFAPVLMYMAVRSGSRAKIRWVLASFAIAVVMQSMVLMVAAVLIALACRKLLIVAQLSIPVVILGLPFLGYFGSRLNIAGEVSNLSTLVYIQGWDQLFESLSLTHGWGVGLLQLGVHGTDSAASVLIRGLTAGADLNLTDGSFELAKLGGEFGVLGIAACAAILMLGAQCVGALRKEQRDPRRTFAYGVIALYSIDIIVRGTGYFTGSTLVFVAAITMFAARGARSTVPRQIEYRGASSAN